MNLDNLLTFWAKSESAGEHPAFHPVLYHLIDVAAAAEALLETNPVRLERIANHLGVEPAALAAAMVRLVVLHDIGKFSRAFQVKRPDLWPAVLGPIEPKPADIPHDNIGFRLLTADQFAIIPRIAEGFPQWRTASIVRLIASVAGHHGEPADENPHFDASRVIGPVAVRAARVAAEEVLDLWPTSSLPKVPEHGVMMLSWALAGLTVLADWLGSNRRWFPSVAPTLLPAGYLENHARPRARRAVREAGLLPAEPAAIREFRELFPTIGWPSPVQELAQTLELPHGPALVLVEDATGSGKTEAALMLAHRLMRKQGLNGIYVALPTMATANAMFSRLAVAYRSLFGADHDPSLVLAHARRRFHPAFSDLALEPPDRPAEAPPGADPANVSAAAFCAAWIADDRRKAFLANVGVGTIDQALLGVLPSRHQSLRLWGLADRVLIVDEAHAYDPYMARELETLLEFQSALGGSAIVLSATLPKATRSKIADAFRRGLDPASSTNTTSHAYPLVTVVGGADFHEHPTALKSQLARRVVVQRLEDTAQAVTQIQNALARDAAVLWVRNTVDEAITAVELLEQAGVPQPLLFHARFAMGDRLAIEKKVLWRFGRERPRRYAGGAVLVATQVVEQSLDLDFDLIVSDLAPIDLMVQRAGRLWRHMDLRPLSTRPIPEPKLLVLSPHPSEAASGDWVRRFSPGTAAVYRDPKILWTSARALEEAGAIETAETASLQAASPGNVRRLVENVYGLNPPFSIPKTIEDAALSAEGEAKAARSQAGIATLKFADGYSRRGPWDDDARVLTRLGDETITLRLARVRDGILVPWCRGAAANDLARDWALSEITVRRRRISGVPESARSLIEAIAAAKATWSRYDRDMPVLVLQPVTKSVFVGTVMRNGTACQLTYDCRLGLRG